LKATETTGLKVATVAIAGNDVVVTILGGTNTEPVGGNISTPALSAGSVTVLQAPSPRTFTLNMGNNKLTLNKGYKLQDINIISAFPSATDGAVEITHPTAGLASVEVTCNVTGIICVEVEGAGFHTLKDVTVSVKAGMGNIGILNNANLSIIGGEVRLDGNNSKITLINSNGVLIAKGLTVDMTGGATSSGTTHTKDSIGIVLNAPGSLVTNSTIRVNKCTLSSGNSIGIDVQHTTGKSTVVGNNFVGYGSSTSCPAVGVNGSAKLSPDPSLPNNNFLGVFGNTVQ
jgi:hypothetical protein